jgi:hypothetical protein
MVALLFGGRLGEPAEESVRDGPRLEQIIDRAEISGVVLAIVPRGP